MTKQPETFCSTRRGWPRPQADWSTSTSRGTPSTFCSTDIYPRIWDEPDMFDGYIRPNLEALTRFYGVAAAQSEAVLLAVT